MSLLVRVNTCTCTLHSTDRVIRGNIISEVQQAYPSLKYMGGGGGANRNENFWLYVSPLMIAHFDQVHVLII